MRTIAPRPSALLLGELAIVLAVVLLGGCLPSKGTIGAVIAQESDSNRLVLREVPPDLAAGKAQLKEGDEILTIDGVDVRAMSAKQVHAALSGDVDSPVKLTLVRGEQILRVTLKRTEARRALKPKQAGN